LTNPIPMVSTVTHSSLKRQINHWIMAANRLSGLDHLASPYAWQGIDHKLGLSLRSSLEQSVGDVVNDGKKLKDRLQRLRAKYLRVEETIHFYTIALNSRTTPGVASLLRACDLLCIKSMERLLMPLEKKTPLVLTYIDKGVGASILKAGLRLWDGNISPVAAIKITQHNLFRPTAIIHETGHQIAHITGWTEELASAFTNRMTNHSEIVREAFSAWSSEIAADAFAFVNTGYASVAALHDVVSGSAASVFAYHQRDPHPISYIRVLMNVEMCRQFYGKGCWDDLAHSFMSTYDITRINNNAVGLIRLCVEALSDVVRILLKSPFQCFGNRALSQIINPDKVSPHALEKLEYIAGPALYTSHAWIWNECLTLLALNGYKIGMGEGDLPALYKQQEDWMTKLGFAVELN
jgi:hypothetical protein